MVLSEIGIAEIARFIDSRLVKLAPKTVNNHLTLLGSMLRMAVELNWLLRVPRIQKLKAPCKEFSYLRTEGQVRLLLNHAREEAEGTFELYATALYTGCRAGELFGLEWANVDLNRRLITVQRSFRKPTKSNRVRYVPILDPLLPVLRGWRLRNPLPLVFPNQHGNMHTPSPRISQETLHKVLMRAGLDRMRFHDLRHTFAAQWVMNGGDIYRLQKILGHASIAMTERYAHLAPDLYAEDWGLMGSGAEVVPASSIALGLAKAKERAGPISLD
jgi:integrase